MSWIFVTFLLASLMHMAEEYWLPGGFMERMKIANPRFAPYVTSQMAVVVNGLQILLCLATIIVGESLLAFSLSIAGLVFINGCVHLIGTSASRRYVPGVITGTVLYIPLALFAFRTFLLSGQIDQGQALFAILLGLAFQFVPLAYFFLASRISLTRHVH